MPGDDSQPAKPNWWQRAVHSGIGQAARWLAVLGLVIWRWQAGVPSTFIGWLPVLVVGVLLLLPEAESVEFAGVKLEMRRTKQEVANLRQQVTQLQVTQLQAAQAGAIGAVFGNDAIREFGHALASLANKVAADEASGVAPRDRTSPGPAP